MLKHHKLSAAALLTAALIFPASAMAYVNITFVTNGDGGSCKSTAVYADGQYVSCVANNNGSVSSGYSENECLGFCTPAIVVNPNGQNPLEAVNAAGVEVLGDSPYIDGQNHVLWVSPDDVDAALKNLTNAGFEIVVIEDNIM